MAVVTVVGGGPAGVAAALAAREAGAAVTLFERTEFPRHKVCGEFLSSEGAVVLDRLGLWEELARDAVPIRRMTLHIGRREVVHRLGEPAYGISRFFLDAAVLDAAVARGVTLRRERFTGSAEGTVWAAGRRAPPPNSIPKDERLFGFKAHFDGVPEDAVDLYLARDCYLGVSPVEGRITNVCGLARLGALRRFDFDFDELIRSLPGARERTAPLRRKWKWLTTGPVTPGALLGPGSGSLYPAGDALAFVDPFTGTGMSNALITGRLAGTAAAHGAPVASYRADCRKVIVGVRRVARLLRMLVNSGLADRLAWLAPGGLLYALTRPRLGR